jgi:hypothetical protein
VSRVRRINAQVLTEQWAWEVTDALNHLPNIVLISGNPNTSGETAGAGTLGLNVASGATQRVWVNQSGTTTSWSWLSYV